MRLTMLGICLVLFGFQPRAQTKDPVVGTWVLNVAKSKPSPGPAPKSETRTYALAGNEIKATSNGVDEGDGKPTSATWTVVYDGKERPLTGVDDDDAESQARGREYDRVHGSEGRQGCAHRHTDGLQGRQDFSP